jgi:AcrR family transcriptional regulator
MAATSKSSKSLKTDPETAILNAAFETMAETGWHDLSMMDVARAADMPLSEIYAVFPDKTALITGLSRAADRAVLAEEHSSMLDEPARDRLFDILMQRFDALDPYKAGIKRLARDLRRDPGSALAGAPQLGRSMAWMLEAAGLSASGLRGCLRVAGLSGVWLSASRAWLTDDTPDLSRTMAALDKALSRADELARTVERRTPGGRNAGAPEGGAPKPNGSGGPEGGAAPE